MKKHLKENEGAAPTNNVGGGNVAGLGVGAQGEPGVSKKTKKKVMPFKVFTRDKNKVS